LNFSYFEIFVFAMNVSFSQNRFSANQISSFQIPSFVTPRKTVLVLSFPVSCVNRVNYIFSQVYAFSLHLLLIWVKFSITFCKEFYFLGFSRVVTLISLLAALKETCSPDILQNYWEQGHIAQKCKGSKGTSKSL